MNRNTVLVGKYRTAEICTKQFQMERTMEFETIFTIFNTNESNPVQLESNLSGYLF